MIKHCMSLLAASLTAFGAYANEGKLIAAVGEISLVRDGLETRLERGAVVKTGDLIKVAAASAAQVRMSDQSIIALGQGTEFKIKDYRFSAEKPAEGNAAFALVKGAFRTITGVIGKTARENYSVQAGVVATIGIRGTHYRLRLCDGDCAIEGANAPANGLYGGVSEGRIGVSNDSGTNDFGADEYFFVADAATRPERLPGPPDLLIDRASFLARVRPAAPAGAAAAAAPETSTVMPTSPLEIAGALNNLNGITLQQLRPAEFASAPDSLAHIAPVSVAGVASSGGFSNIGGTGTIRGQIIWLTNADIDLHMLAPNASHVYYGNKTVNLGAATAVLDHDNLGGVIDIAPDQRVENINVNGTQIPTGTYNFYAHSYSGGNNGLPTNVQVRVTGDGNATGLADTFTLSSGQTSSKYNVNYQGAATAPTYSK